MDEGFYLYEESGEQQNDDRLTAPSLTIISFSLGDEWYAADVANVLEVLDVPPITRIPHLPDHIVGVANVRGSIVSVTDLLGLFGLGETTVRPDTRIIVTRAAGRTTALLADSVGGVLGVDPESIGPTLSTIPDSRAVFARGEIRLPDGRLLTLLDLETIMQSERMRFE